MNPVGIKELTHLLQEGIFALGIKPVLALDNNQINQFLLYLNTLQEYTRRINITSIKTATGIISNHFIDSLSCFLGFRSYNGIKVIDIGSGAGFPGVPLKIYNPEIKLTLLEISLKHIEFLYRVRGILGINFEILNGRAEEYGHKKEYREGFDLAVSRGVASLNVLIEYALPFLKKGGLFIAQKAREIEKEKDEATEALELLGGQIKTIKGVILPFTNKKRNLVVIEKIRNTPFQYPRRVGVVLKRSLHRRKNG